MSNLFDMGNGNDLENLAQLIALNQQQNTRQGPETVSVGGHNILVKRDALSRVGNAGMGALSNLAQGVMLNKRNQFIQGVKDVIAKGGTPNDVANNLMPIISTNPQLAKELGILDVLELYNKQKTNEWKPTTKEEAIDFEKSKADAKNNKYTPDEIVDVLKKLSVMGDTIPPGTTLKIGDFNIPLNPKLTQDQAASVAAATEVNDDVNSLKSLLQKKAGSPGIIAKTKLPYWMVGGDTEEMKRLRDQLAARIPFAKGGKQLTPFEAKTLFALLPQPGQELATINKNLDKFVSEFNKMSEIAKKGTAGAGVGSSQNPDYANYLKAIGVQ